MMELNIIQPLSPTKAVARFAGALSVTASAGGRKWETMQDAESYDKMIAMGDAITTEDIKGILGGDAVFAFGHFCDCCEATAIPLADWGEFTLCRKCLRTAVDLIDGL